MDKEQVTSFLHQHHQSHLIRHMEQLNAEELKIFYKNLEEMVLEDYLDRPQSIVDDYLETDIHPLSNQLIDASPSSAILPNCQHGIFILAAGDGSRLGFDKPKALFPVMGKSLIEHHFSRILSIQNRVNMPIEVGILLSKKKGPFVLKFLQEHRYFGIDPKQVHPIYQKNYVFIDDKHHWQLSNKLELASGPCGNGEAIYCMRDSGFLNLFKDDESIHLIPIDNPLALNAFYPLCNEMNHHDLALIVFKRSDPSEKLGVIVQYKDRLIVLDYPHFPKNLYSNLERFPYANTNIMSFKVSFLHSLQKSCLPFYTVSKKVKIFENNQIVEKEMFRFERFITDIVQYAKNPIFICSDRHQFYAALKDMNSIKEIEYALNAKTFTEKQI